MSPRPKKDYAISNGVEEPANTYNVYVGYNGDNREKIRQETRETNRKRKKTVEKSHTLTHIHIHTQ